MKRIACLFACVCVLQFARVKCQVGSLCRPNERFLHCGGCQRTCLDPVPDCKGVCREGCYCEGDEVRNATGHCVKLAECPPLPAYKLDTTEPRPTDVKCPENEEYRFCEPCNRTCENPNPICPAQCARGCFCNKDLVRDVDGRCVKLHNCSRKLINEIPRQQYTTKPIKYEMTCSENQVYKDCETCEKTCSNPNPHCPAQCSRGCFCKDGFFKAPNGKCVELQNCPRAEVLVGLGPEPRVEDCQADEVYYSCGWCEPTCSEPRPQCPPRVCTRGCLCRAPLVRHRSGQCVKQNECYTTKCRSPDEVFDCHYGCEEWCSPRVCVSRARRCSVGCRCRNGLRRDHLGNCVTPDLCIHQATRINYTAEIIYNKLN